MGRNTHYPVRVEKTWLQSLGAMIDEEARIRTSCEKCGRSQEFTRDDLVRLAEKVGRNYSLINRRTHCRLTPGCDGWNRFFYLNGVYRPLWDEDYAAAHW